MRGRVEIRFVLSITCFNSMLESQIKKEAKAKAKENKNYVV